jgi:hypothetical protein
MALVLPLDVEHFLAQMTGIFAFVFQHVLIEFVLSRYDFPAHVARNLRIVTVPLNVPKIRSLSHVVVNFPTDLAGVRDVLVFVELQVRFEILVTFEVWAAVMAREMLAGVTNAVASQPLFLFKAFSADNARIVFSRVNISAMFPQMILTLEFHAASAANRALALAGKWPFFCALPKSENWSIF